MNETLRSSKWDPCFGWITSVFCCSQVSIVAQAGVHQTHAGCMIREDLLLEFLGGIRTSHSEIHHTVFLNETQRVLLSFSLEEVSAQWDIVILHTTDRPDLPQTWDIAVLTKLTYVNIFQIFNYFQHREYICRPLPVILHLSPLQTAWEKWVFLPQGT